MDTPEPVDPWDEYADAWDDDAIAQAYSAAAFESLTTALADRGRSLAAATVCDFGCGTGLLTERMVDAARSIDAIDTSTAMLARLSEKIDAHAWSNVHPSATLPTTVETHDIVVCSSVLAFVADYSATVTRLAALLRASGLFVQWDWEQDPQDPDGDGLRRDDVREVLTAAGLIDVDVATGFEASVDGVTMRPLIGIGRKP